MKKPNEKIVVNSNSNKEKILKTIVEQIGNIFSNTKIYDTKNMNKLIEKITTGNKNSIWNTEEIQKKCFETIVYIINNLWKQTNIKKFYNTAPYISLTKYAHKDKTEQLLHNIYHSNRQRFYQSEMGWWNCHYRTVLFKRIFDIFKEQWLQIDSKIIVYKNIGWHSFLLVIFQWEKYIMDVWGIDMISKKTVTPIKELENNIQESINKQLRIHRQKNAKIHIYDDILNFAEYIDTKPIKNIAVHFRPKLEDVSISSDIEISINKKNIQMQINDHNYVIYIHESYKPWDHINNNRQLFEDILNNNKTDSKTKEIYNKYIYMIAEKISYYKLRWLREKSNNQ
jgi:hypothetical protein